MRVGGGGHWPSRPAVGRGPPAAPAGPIWPQMAPLHAPPTQTTQNLPFAHKPQPWGAAWVQKRPFTGRFGPFSAQALPFWLPPHQPLALQHAPWHTTSPLGANGHNARAPPGSEAPTVGKKSAKNAIFGRFQHFLAPRTLIVFARLLLGHCHIIGWEMGPLGSISHQR